MSTYIVRMIGSKELVGLFWAESLTGLADAIDECVSPTVCEAKKLPIGGVYWPTPIEVSVPLPDDICDESEETPVDAARAKLPAPDLSQMLLYALYEEKGWRPVFKDDADFRKWLYYAEFIE